MRYSSWALITMMVASPSRGTAQTSVEIGPLIGYYRPFGSFEPASVYMTSLPSAPEDLRGPAWGGEIRAWFGKRFGAAVRASVAPSTIPSVITPAGRRGPTRAEVTMVTLEGLLTIIGTPQQHQIWVSAGAGALTHGGDAYAQLGTPTDVGPVVGAGSRIRITDRVHAAVGVSALTYMLDVPMPPALRLNPGSLQRGRQLDALFSVGVSWILE